MCKRGFSVLLLLISFIFSVSCTTKGNGVISSTDFSLQNFNSVEIFGSPEVKIYYAKTQSVRLTTDENLKRFVFFDVDSNILSVYTDKKNNFRFTKYLVEIYTDDLKSISCDGSSNVHFFDKMNSFEALSISGSATIQFNEYVELENLEGEIRGSGKITAKGSCNKLNLSIAGSGKFYGSEFETENVDVRISGSGVAELFAIKMLNGKINGSGKIFYKGSPAVNSHINGSGVIRKI